jgi:hypothetical protein
MEEHMKNKLSDLNDHLFAQIEWLSDRDVKGKELEEEVLRARAVCAVADKVIANGRLVMDAAKAAGEYPGIKKHAPLLE